jgi:hypothetical protein
MKEFNNVPLGVLTGCSPSFLDFYFIAKTSKYLLNFDIELKIKGRKNKNAEKRGN